jgi:hypothetical protein
MLLGGVFLAQAASSQRQAKRQFAGYGAMTIEKIRMTAP